MGLVFDQRRSEGELEGFAVVDRDVGYRLHGIEVLGQAHRQPGGAQLNDKAV